MKICSDKKAYMMASKWVLFTFLLLLSSFAEAVIEDSIIPAVEKFELIKNLSKNKYSHEQLKTIKKALCEKRHRLRVVTYNMLFNLYDQNLSPENRWPERLPRIVELLNEMNADIIGVQELQPDQLNGLLPLLSDKYSFFFKNAPNEDRDQDGIFYKTDRFKVLKRKCFPMNPGALAVLWLKDRVTHQSVVICNTHLAFSKIEQRTAQAHYIAKKVHRLASQFPVIFMGDLNTFPNRPDVVPQFPALDGDYIDHILTGEYQGKSDHPTRTLEDAIHRSIIGHLGPISTFTNKEGSVAPFAGTGL